MTDLLATEISESSAPPAGHNRLPNGVLGEVTLAMVTVAAGMGLLRLFSDTKMLVPVVLAGILSHGLAAFLRRRQLSVTVSGGISGVALTLVIGWSLLPETTSFGIPGPTTLRTAARELAEAWSRFGTVVAPTPTLRGFVVASVVATWWSAFLADLFAFRVRTRFEALVPSFTIFLFGALLGAPQLRVTVAAAYLAGIITFLSVTETAPGGRSRWVATAVGLVSVLVAIVVGPRLPGAGSAELVDWRGDGGAPRADRVTVSPLVDIRGRILDPSDTPLFAVTSPEPTYWRLTSLDRFDGVIWSARSAYRPTSSSLANAGDGATRARPISQRFEISGLASIWLPAAYRPRRITDFRAGDGAAPTVSFDAVSSSLVTSQASAAGLNYTVESALPVLDADRLRTAPLVSPPGSGGANTELPSSLSPRVEALAREVVAGRSGPYEQARGLQDWFRSQFTYSLDVEPGHGIRAMERFLFETRAGYCEQFAGSFAAMARSLGLPSRVAVGFTAGETTADGRLRVRARDAHAWPEVYLGGFGWVAFEPTPGRSIPGADDYTGVNSAPPGAPEDDGASGDSPPATAPPLDGEGELPPKANATEDPEPGAASPSNPGESPPIEGGADQSPASPRPTPELPESEQRWPIAVWLAIAVVAAVLAPPLAALITRRRRQKARRNAADTPAARVALAWEESVDVLARIGLGAQRFETPTEYADRLRNRLGPSSDALDDLALGATRAFYGTTDPGPQEVADAVTASVAVRQWAVATAGPWRTRLADLDPRGLWLLPRSTRTPESEPERTTTPG